MKSGAMYLAVVICLPIFLLLEAVSAASYQAVVCSGGKHATTHEKCCAFYALRDDLQENLFKHSCGDAVSEVRKVLRLAFHDAIGYSLSRKYVGDGADGSLLTFSDIELLYLANIGIDVPVNFLKPVVTRYSQVSAGDLVQFAAAVGLTNCPGAARLEFLAGRPDPIRPASDGTIPSPGDNVTTILDRLADAGFSAEEFVFLLAGHSIARASHVDSSVNASLDSSPEVFDSQFFLEVLLKGRGYPGNGSSNPFEAPSALYSEGEMRLHSDYLLARDDRTACTWQSLVDNQLLMMEGFRSSMSKLAVIGQNKAELVDCSDTVPLPKPICEERFVSAAYPPGQCYDDVERSCAVPFPTVSGASILRQATHN
ncbi:hypothetical protein ACEPAH_7060 [Sanghuangporus vaninii]